MEGMFSIKTRAMGGKLVLLDSEDKEELKEIIENAKAWLNQWFDDVTPWDPTMVATKRTVWLKCFGVPLHVWGLEFFASIASVWEKFISLDDNTRLKKRFDVAKVLIFTTEKKIISKGLNYKINGEDKSKNSDWVKESTLESSSHGFQHEGDGPTEPSEEKEDDMTYNRWRVGGQEEGFFKLNGNRVNFDSRTIERISQVEELDLQMQSKGAEAEHIEEKAEVEVVEGKAKAKITEEKAEAEPIEEKVGAEPTEEKAQAKLVEEKTEVEEEGDSFWQGVSGLWGAIKIPVYIMNVYGPCEAARKRMLWEELQMRIDENRGNWCLLEDFNATRSQHEKA
ncbi:hypothetical protein SLEP1_g36396 [Rubroshorea leprosula]|uniref:DUF4283 domain-containing protein n=1 Tax=Rubroshorea leprosula TaxID=152421 RepID=A0AAV5KRI1_9ROSI|nr:hypothetical protein SLEP1_g36396 [Rubroshorea leprosula]